jgi:hypothetical protein
MLVRQGRMSEHDPRSRLVTNPPPCPTCGTNARVVLEHEPRDGDDHQVWRCGRCGVRWEVTLTPRFER